MLTESEKYYIALARFGLINTAEVYYNEYKDDILKNVDIVERDRIMLSDATLEYKINFIESNNI